MKRRRLITGPTHRLAEQWTRKHTSTFSRITRKQLAKLYKDIPFPGVQRVIDLLEYRHLLISVASGPGIEGLDDLRSKFFINFYEWGWKRGEEVLESSALFSILVNHERLTARIRKASTCWYSG